MAAPSVSNSFSNGTTIDAAEMNTNFNDIINALTDGTSDLTFGALTAQGATTLNGTVALGNATGDTVTITGYIGSTMIPDTNASYDMGSSSLAWQALYLDNGATDGGAIYFDAGSTEFIKANAAGTDLALGGFTDFDLAGARVKHFGLDNQAKSADYTVLDNDGVSVILMTTGSSTDKTVTLPTVADNDGRVITVKKVDPGTKKCIVDGEGSEAIDSGTVFNLTQQYDSITLQSDGSKWHIISKDLIVNGSSSVDTPTGHGSSGTHIRTFTSGTKVESGTSVTYTSDTTDGDYFTINEDGIYAISYTDSRSGGTSAMAISLNSSGSKTTNATSLASSVRLILARGAAGIADNVSTTVRLSSGDEIRAHDNSSNDGTNNYLQIRVAQVERT